METIDVLEHSLKENGCTVEKRYPAPGTNFHRISKGYCGSIWFHDFNNKLSPYFRLDIWRDVLAIYCWESRNDPEPAHLRSTTIDLRNPDSLNKLQEFIKLGIDQ